jgi:hypothetical protein
MAEPLEDDTLRSKGFTALEERLGPVQALRFLALISREPFDYQGWRERHFAGMSHDQILAEVGNGAAKR